MRGKLLKGARKIWLVVCGEPAEEPLVESFPNRGHQVNKRALSVLLLLVDLRSDPWSLHGRLRVLRVSG